MHKTQGQGASEVPKSLLLAPRRQVEPGVAKASPGCLDAADGAGHGCGIF